MSENVTPNPSGYPDSSPAEGAELGATPTPNEGDRHEPTPDSPRWNEVYRNWKDEARANEELRQRVAELEMGQTLAPTLPTPEQTAPVVDEGDETAWLKDLVSNAVNESISPLQERLAAQERAAQTQATISAFQAAHPDYVPTRDQEILVSTMNRYGVRNPEAAYRIAFPERVVGQVGNAPVSDVRGVSAHVPAENAEVLMARFNDPKTPESERSLIAMKLTDMGGYGGAVAEKALGF